MNALAYSVLTSSALGLVVRMVVAISLVVLVAAAAAALVARRRPALRASIWVQSLGAVILVPVLVWAMAHADLSLVRVAIEAPAVVGSPSPQVPEASLPFHPRTPAVFTDGDPPVTDEPFARALNECVRMDAVQPATSPVPGARGAAALGRGPLEVVMAGVWVAGVAIALIRLGFGFRQSRRIRSAARPATSADGLPLERLRSCLGRTDLPPILVSTDTRAPFVHGLANAAVIVPQSLIGTLSANAWLEVLLHECAHVMRRDPVVGFAQRIVAAVFWPHPFIHLMNRALAVAREETCDNFVLKATSGAGYARTLLDLTQSLGHVRPLALTMGVVPLRWRLEERVRGLLDRGRELSTSPRLRHVVGVMASLAFVTALATGTAFVASAVDVPSSEPVFVLQGTVRETDGTEVAGAEVFALEPDYASTRLVGRTTTDAHGQYRLELPRSAIRNGRAALDPLEWLKVCATAPGHAIAYGDVRDPEVRNSADFEFLAADDPIEGRILDIEGLPRAGARVRVIEVTLPETPTAGFGVDAPESTLHLGMSLDAVIPSAVTDADGRFVLRGIGRGRRAMLVVDAPGTECRRFFVTVDKTLTTPTRLGYQAAMSDTMMMQPEALNGTAEHYGPVFTHMVPSVRPFRGTVTEAKTGNPIPDVSVVVVNGPNSDVHFEAKTDAAGHYVIHGVPEGTDSCVVRFIPPPGTDWVQRDGDLAHRSTDPRDGIDVSLERGVRIRGRVVEKGTGKPVRARAEYLPFDGNPHRRDMRFGSEAGYFGGYRLLSTDFDGNFEVIGVAGRAAVTVVALEDAYVTEVPSHFEDDVDSGGRLREHAISMDVRTTHAIVKLDPPQGSAPVVLSIELNPGNRQRVDVVDEAGSAVADVLVTGLTPLFYGSKAVPGAGFDVIGLAKGEERQIIVRDAARHLGGSTVVVHEPTEPSRLVLHPCGRIHGRIVDQRKNPCAGWNIPVMMLKSGAHAAPDMHIQEWRTTDADGRFEFDAVGDVVYELYGERFLVRSGETRDAGDVSNSPRRRR